MFQTYFQFNTDTSKAKSVASINMHVVVFSKQKSFNVEIPLCFLLINVYNQIQTVKTTKFWYLLCYTFRPARAILSKKHKMCLHKFL